MTNDLRTIDLRLAVEDFLFREAALLDAWELTAWLELFTPDARYLVPATDLPDGDPDRDLFVIHDDRFLLEHRVASLLTRSAHAEYPHARTRRFVSNVLAERLEADGSVIATANFVIYRMRRGVTDQYVGQYRHVLVQTDRDFLIRERRATLDLEALRPHGKVSIIV